MSAACLRLIIARQGFLINISCIYLIRGFRPYKEQSMSTYMCSHV